MVVFWKMMECKIKEETREVPMLRYYRVFHIDDLEDLDPNVIPSNSSHHHDFKTIECCEQVIKSWNDAPVITLGKTNACYIPTLDEVQIPHPENFFKDEEFYATLYHELIHSTGHHKRLSRHEKFSNLNFGSKDYSQEELVAEMGAAYLCGISGIDNATIDNSVAYIQGWLKKLKSDKKFIISAASLAKKAVDYILKD